jgi:hypothetical protein
LFRSGRLTKARLNQILRWVERLPHDLKAVAKACNIYPSDLLAWYAAGQDPDCRDLLMVELSWKIAEIRAERKAENYERIVAAASVGKKVKIVEKENSNPDLPPTKETHTEDVLPAAWAIEKLDALSNASAWEISPDNEQAAELHRMLGELTPTPLLTDGHDNPIPEPAPSEGNEQPEADPSGDGASAPVH